MIWFFVPRLQCWFILSREYNTVSPKMRLRADRGCLQNNNVVTCLLLIDMVRQKDMYDLICNFLLIFQRRNTWYRGIFCLGLIKRSGCCVSMLFALVAMYLITRSYYRESNSYSDCRVVRQGSSMSRLLFVFFM